VTCFGLLFTPAFYTFVRKVGHKSRTLRALGGGWGASDDVRIARTPSDTDGHKAPAAD
jgi:hypothetical protein